MREKSNSAKKRKNSFNLLLYLYALNKTMENQKEEQAQNEQVISKKEDYTGGWGILLLEVFWIFIVHHLYPVFSVWAWGMEKGSFTFTQTNFYIYLALIVLPPTFLNILKFIRQHKKQQPIGRYITAQVVVLIVFTAIIFGSFSWDF